MLLLLLLATAYAQQSAADDSDADAPVEEAATAPADAPADDVPEPEWQSLDVPGDFSSALDTVATDADTIAEDPTRVEDLVPGALLLPTPRARLRSRFTARPWLGAAVLQGVDHGTGGWGPAAGLSLGHQWWSLREARLRPVGQTRLVGALPFAGAHGWMTSLDATAGAWAGPVGLLGGGAIRAESLSVPEGAALDPALAVGPRLHLAAEAGPLTPWVAVSPLWMVAGGRTTLDAPWDELELSAGLAVERRPFALRLSGSRLDTAQGVAWGASLGLALRLL